MKDAVTAGAALRPPAETAARRRALTLLACALVLGMATWFSASAVVPQLGAIWGLSRSAAAWLTIAVQLGFVAGALVSSMTNLADIFPPGRVILIGALSAALANVVLVLAEGPAQAIPLRFATGFCLAGVYPPALKLMATWFLKGRGTALGVMVGALTIGSASPHLLNALGALDWRSVVFATSALTVMGGMLAGLAVDEGPHPFPRATFDPRQARIALADRGVRLTSLGYFGHMWELYAMWAWFLVFVSAAMHLHGVGSGAAPALVTFAVIASGGLGCGVGGVLGDRWGRTTTTAAMMLVSGVCALTIGLSLAGPLWLTVAVGLLWGFSVVGDSAQFSTIVTELADQAYVGTALTLQLALGFTLTVATIWLVPLVQGFLGWRWAFTLLAPGPALGILAMLRLRGLPVAERIAGGRG